MFQNCLTMPHTTVPTIWMDTALWVSCSAYLSGMVLKYLIFPFLLVIVCGRKKSLNWNWQPPWSGRLYLNFTAKILSSSFVTVDIQNRTWHPSLMNIQIWIWLAMQGLILSCMILHLHRPEVTVWNTFHCCYIRFARILKQATMNRKRSGLFVTIWREAAKGLKCWSIWLTSVTVPWRLCPIRTNIFLNTVQKAYRSFVLN